MVGRLLIILILSSCTTSGAHFVEKNYEERAGVLSWASGSDVELRRADAGYQAWEFCRGPYDVTREVNGSQVTGSVKSEFGTVNTSRSLTYMQFRCRQ